VSGAADTVGLAAVARVIRSKNAGPYRLTLDIVFRDRATYERVKASGALTAETVAAAYRIPVADVTDFTWFDLGGALKATLRRPVTAASVGDGDVYGAQQHAPLLGIELPASVAGA
jgi:hypothetical protein